MGCCQSSAPLPPACIPEPQASPSVFPVFPSLFHYASFSFLALLLAHLLPSSTSTSPQDLLPLCLPLYASPNHVGLCDLKMLVMYRMHESLEALVALGALMALGVLPWFLFFTLQ